MPRPTLNLRSLNFLIADPNSFSSGIIHTMLRGFGAAAVHEAADVQTANEIMSSCRIDALLCDYRLPPTGGIEFTRTIRRDRAHPCRSIPVLIMASEAKLSVIGGARDAGAHMIIGKPMSPAALYDRLVWIAYKSRGFVEFPGYFGPDRRFKFEGSGTGRRKDDTSQDEVSSLFESTQKAAG
jgi:two-component system, chemotaxis family, chemotaxis protein CheY